MSLSIQTNVNALVAQQNLSVNGQFQSRTIQRLTSGYRINSSADDAAGLSVANQYRSSTAELTQGVHNANDGVAQLQIADGGLSNISQMLDRLKTLATQSASTTFSGSRTTLNNEFQSLLGEIDRQAQNIKLDTNGSLATHMKVYIGGGNNTNATNSNAMVSVDLSSAHVDSAGLSLNSSSILGGGVEFSGTLTNALLSDPSAKFTADQSFVVNYVDGNGAAQSKTVGYTAGGGLTGSQVVTALNSSLNQAGVTGITTQIGSDGQLQFVGGGAFTVTTTTGAGKAVMSATPLAMVNTGQYNALGTRNFAGYADGDHTAPADTVHFTDSALGKSADFTFNKTTASDLPTAVNSLNTFFEQQGMSMRALAQGNQLSIQSSGNFTMVETAFTANGGGTATGDTGFGSAQAVGDWGKTNVNVQTSATGSALAAVDAISAAIGKLGTIQGKIGAGQNMLNYAISLAQSQITNFSSAESQIRDADVASEAANLSKAQVLQQASIAAMAQANTAPQAVLSLLKG